MRSVTVSQRVKIRNATMTTQKPCERATVGPSISPYIYTKKNQVSADNEYPVPPSTPKTTTRRKKKNTQPQSHSSQQTSRLQNMIVMFQIILLKRASHPLPIMVVDALWRHRSSSACFCFIRKERGEVGGAEYHKRGLVTLVYRGAWGLQEVTVR